MCGAGPPQVQITKQHKDGLQHWVCFNLWQTTLSTRDRSHITRTALHKAWGVLRSNVDAIACRRLERHLPRQPLWWVKRICERLSKWDNGSRFAELSPVASTFGPPGQSCTAAPRRGNPIPRQRASGTTLAQNRQRPLTRASQWYRGRKEGLPWRPGPIRVYSHLRPSLAVVCLTSPYPRTISGTNRTRQTAAETIADPKARKTRRGPPSTPVVCPAACYGMFRSEKPRWFGVVLGTHIAVTGFSRAVVDAPWL